MGIFWRVFKPNVKYLDFEGLTKALWHRNHDVRREAARAIANKLKMFPNLSWSASSIREINDKRGVEPFCDLLNDEDLMVRNGAIRALHKIKDKRGVEPLCDVLKDGYLDIQEEAITVLGEIGDPRAVEPLVRALKHENKFFRRQAARALGRIGDARAIEPLIHALKSTLTIKGAAWALGEIGDPRAVEPLVQLFRDRSHMSKECGHAAATALRKIGEPAVESLIQALNDEDWRVRKNAAAVLKKSGWEPENDVQKAHFLIIKGKWGELAALGKPAVEPLMKALRDEDLNVAWLAAGTLIDIGDPIGQKEAEKAKIVLLKQKMIEDSFS